MATYKKKTDPYKEIKQTEPLQMSSAPPSQDLEMKAKIEDYKKKVPQFEGRELVYPNGERIKGSFASLVSMKQDFLKNNPDIVNPEKVALEDKRIAADYALGEKKKAYAEAQNPINTTPEQLAQIGQLDPTILNENNPLTNDINRMADLRKQESLRTADRLTVGNVLSPVISPNKVSSEIAGFNPLGIPIGRTFMNVLGQNEKVRTYLEDYKMDDEYAKVKTSISDAEKVMNGAITQARKKGADKDDAIKNYNAAWSRIAVAEQQLKAIAGSDQRAWADEVKNKQVEVYNVLYGETKRQKDQMMAIALSVQPDMVDNSQDGMNGGLFNG